MNCDLCSTAAQGGETRCRRCGFDTTLPPEIKRFLTSLVGFRPGELLGGRYRIDRILGCGGMSVVYKAHDDVLGEDVAIKVINSDRVADDAKFFTDIRRDIVSSRKLAHPDIVKIHDFHKADACGFLTMEYVQGKDLSSLIAERGKLEEGEVCRLAVQVAEALAYAHANGVIHCDIKPGNLLLTETGRVKIADFGISRVMHEGNSGLTGLVVGTPAYMSPEQIRGERPTPLTDMYALGIVMWHCLMGAPPFTRGDIAYQHAHVPLPPMDGVSPTLESIVRKAASKAMADRYPSLDVMAQELHQFLWRQVEATIVQTPPPQQAATIVQTPPPRPVSNPYETAHKGTLATGVPTDGGPASGTAQPSPTPPPASKKIRLAIAAVAVLLAGAVLWGLFPRSRQTGSGGSESTLIDNNLPTGGGNARLVGSTAGDTTVGGTSSPNIPSPGKPTRRAADATPAPHRATESPQTTVAVSRDYPPLDECKRAACFEFFDAELTPSVAQPGQTVRCTTRFTFRHNEGGTGFLEVEASAQLGIRSSRAVSRRIKAGPGANLFEASFKVPNRTRAGTYPVTISVRRRSITQRKMLQLVVTH